MNKETRMHYSCALASTLGDILALKENARAPLCEAFIKHGRYTNTASEVHSLFARLFVTDIQVLRKKYGFTQFEKNRAINFMRHFFYIYSTMHLFRILSV